jgi:hypothetical protein
MALILLILGVVLAYSHTDASEEITLDKWDPVTPSTLSPQNQTGWAYMDRTQGGSFLKLNVTASNNVRLMIGLAGSSNVTEEESNVTEEETWANLIFNQSGTRFTQEVAIAGTAADCLEIKNDGTTPVNISGNVAKVADVYQTVYPEFYSGALVMLLGFILLIFGIVIRPARKRTRIKYLKGKL